MIDYLQIFVCIITSVIYIVVCLIVGQDANITLLRLIYVILISYIAGLILKVYLKKKVFYEEEASEEDTVGDSANSLGSGVHDSFDEDDF